MPKTKQLGSSLSQGRGKLRSHRDFISAVCQSTSEIVEIIKEGGLFRSRSAPAMEVLRVDSTPSVTLREPRILEEVYDSGLLPSALL